MTEGDSVNIQSVPDFYKKLGEGISNSGEIQFSIVFRPQLKKRRPQILHFIWEIVL